MPTKMLNLRLGEYYRMETSYKTVYKGRVVSRTFHGNSMHSYLVAWPHETEPNPYALYLWDYGYVNRMKDHYYSEGGIWSCRPLDGDELLKMKLWFNSQEERRKRRRNEIEKNSRNIHVSNDEHATQQAVG